VQSFEYRFSRTLCAEPAGAPRQSTAEAFNSFSQLDLNLNKGNTLKFVAALFPKRSVISA